MNRILWLVPKSFSSKGRSAVERYIRGAGLNPGVVTFVNMHSKIDKMWIRKGKTKFVASPELKGTFTKLLNQMIEVSNSTMIVIQDKACLEYITGQTSLDLCRGSIYRFNELPCIVVDEIQKTHTIKHGGWLFINDLKKVSRWFNGSCRTQPKFIARYCANRDDLISARDTIINSLLVSCDIETCEGFITVIGYSCLNPDGRISSFSIPFFNPRNSGNCHWASDTDEIFAWQIVREINASKVPKIFQNGSYDNAYLLVNRSCPFNYVLDVMHLWHSIYAEAPKKLNFITSVLLDHCKYWKDENKDDAGKDAKRKADTVPRTEEGYQRYLRYNLLDVYYTLLDAIFLVNFITKPELDWALSNYNTEFRSQVGPAFFMSMTGVRRNKERQRWHNIQWIKEHKQAIKDLRTMVDDEDFNPNSQPQVASLIYDVLGATPIVFKGAKKKTPRSVDEKVLSLIKVQHPIYSLYIQKLWDAKKPANNASKYGTMYCPNDRFLYQYSAAGTKFGRYSGKGHMFWCGNNPQNVPYKAMDMFVADKGYILCKRDYSQSDAWFVAFESEDDHYMRNISDNKDTHSVHAEHFFNRPYNEIHEGYINKADWVVHPIHGVRQNAKRIVHGANYRMMGFTLYITMGHEAVVASAKAVGHKDAHLWDRDKLVDFCAANLRSYYKLYPRLLPYFEEQTRDCVANGNRATCAFGNTHLFFGNIAKDNTQQRALSSFFGQGGTAGNINRTLNYVFYESGLIQDGLILLMQTHDSIEWESPEDKFVEHHAKFKQIMEQPCTVRGREFIVPSEGEIGYSFGPGMIDYCDDGDEGQVLDLIKKENELDLKYNTVEEEEAEIAA